MYKTNQMFRAAYRLASEYFILSSIIDENHPWVTDDDANSFIEYNKK